MQFTVQDVSNLKRTGGDDAKLELVKKLYHNFQLDKMSPNEKLVAEEILRYLAADISARVRQSISVKFCDSIEIPYDIALKLAHDMEDIVAVPMIENSKILTEKDVIGIIETGSQTRQQAVASRTDLSDNVCAHIIYRSAPEVIQTLINNKSAKLSEGNSEVLIKAHSKNHMLMRQLINNKKISMDQAHKLLSNVSDELRKMLIVEYEIPSSVVNNLVVESKEWMVLNLILGHLEKHPNSLPLRHIIEKLHAEGELTFSILIKALSLGDVLFFESAMAKLANISIDNAQKLLRAEDNFKSFQALYTKCDLPESMMEAIYHFMTIARSEKDAEVEQIQSVKTHHRILNRLSRASNNENVNNLDYLVTIVAYNLRKSNLL